MDRVVSLTNYHVMPISVWYFQGNLESNEYVKISALLWYKKKEK